MKETKRRRITVTSSLNNILGSAGKIWQGRRNSAVPTPFYIKKASDRYLKDNVNSFPPSQFLPGIFS
jgi:hypothetical protein